MVATGIIIIVVGAIIGLSVDSFALAMGSLFFGGALLIAAAAKKERRKKERPVDIPPVFLGTGRELKDEDRLTPESWVVLDVETTGLQPESDRIIEIAMRKYENGVPVETFTSLANPGRPLPEKVVQLTGITDRKLRKAPRFADIVWKTSEFVDGLPVVAHNARFDVEFLLNEWARCALTKDIWYIDTVKLAREAFPGQANYKLATLIRSLGLLDREQEHRALSDVDAAGKLYLLCRQKLGPDYARRRREREEAEIVRQEKLRREEEARKQEQARREDKLRHAAAGETRAAVLADLGKQYEAEGDIDKAVYYFGQAVAEHCEQLHPYKRLAVLYRKRREYEEELRVCQAAIQMLEWQEPYNAAAAAEFEKRIAWVGEKLGE